MDQGREEPIRNWRKRVRLNAKGATSKIPSKPNLKTKRMVHLHLEGVEAEHLNAKGATSNRKGRPPLLDENQKAELLAFLEYRVNKKRPANVPDALHFLNQKFGADMLPNSFRKWLNKNTDFKTAYAPPVEEKRLSVTIEQITDYFKQLQKIMVNVPSAFVYNLDESGFEKFSDAQHNTVIVHKSCTKPALSVARQEKRATMLVTIAADGSALKPLLILPRQTIDDEVFRCGISPREVMFAFAKKGYITTKIFTQYLEEVFLPSVRATRNEMSYHGPAILIMDQCSCHCSEEIDKLFRENGIVKVLLPPHSSDQAQPLDLGIFGNMKNCQSRIHPPNDISVQSKQVIKMICAFRASTHGLAVTSAFKRAGISSMWEISSRRLIAVVTYNTATAIRDIPVEWADPIATTGPNHRIIIDDRLLGTRPDSFLPEHGLVEFFDEERGIEDLPILPDEPYQLEDYENSLLIICPDFVKRLWNGPLIASETESDESDDIFFAEDAYPQERGETMIIDSPISNALNIADLCIMRMAHAQTMRLSNAEISSCIAACAMLTSINDIQAMSRILTKYNGENPSMTWLGYESSNINVRTWMTLITYAVARFKDIGKEYPIFH